MVHESRVIIGQFSLDGGSEARVRIEPIWLNRSLQSKYTYRVGNC